MARIRTIKPEFRTSPSTAKVSRDARLTFLLLLTEADDEGRFVATPKLLAGSLFPHDEDVTQARISKWMAELEAVGMVELYESDGVRYGNVVHFNKHQRVSHPTPSRIPPPPRPTDSGGSPESLPNDSGAPPEPFRPDLGSGTGNREQGKGSPPESRSSSSSSLPVIGDDDDGTLRREAQARLDRRVAEKGPVGDPKAWLATCVGRLRNERHVSVAQRERIDGCPTCEGVGVVELPDGSYRQCRHEERVSA